MINLLLRFTAMLLAVAAIACSHKNNDSSNYGKAIEFQPNSLIDSLYLNIDNTEKNAISSANIFFSALNDEEFTDSLIQFASSATPQEAKAHATYWMGEYLFETYRFPEALKIAQSAVAQAGKIQDLGLQSECYSLLSSCYQKHGLLEDALAALQKCYEYSQSIGDNTALSSDLNNLAVISLAMKQPEMAQQYIDKAIEIEKYLDREYALAIRYAIASEVYSALGELDTAENYIRNAYALEKNGNRNGKAAVRLTQLAAILAKKGETDKAIQVLTEAIPTLQEVGNNYSLSIAQNQMGNLLLSKGDDILATQHFQDALDITRNNGNLQQQHNALTGLSNALRNIDLKLAYQYLQEGAIIADSIYKVSNQKQLAEIELKYKEDQARDKAEHQAQTDRLHTKISWGIVILCIAIILVLCYIIYTRNKAQKRLTNMENVVVNTLLDKGQYIQGAQESDMDEASSSANHEFIRKIVDFVLQQLSQGRDVDTNDCASHLCISPRQFSRKLQALTGDTPVNYITRIKIGKAKRLLDSRQELSISEISEKCGYEDNSYFSRVFKQYEGLTPTQYRNRVR